jgi:hypothetical protein
MMQLNTLKIPTQIFLGINIGIVSNRLSSFPLVTEGNGGWIPALARTSYKRQRNLNGSAKLIKEAHNEKENSKKKI